MEGPPIAAAPVPLDPESAAWLAELRGAGRTAAVRRLHGYLLKAGRGEIAGRRALLAFGGHELEDLAEQAADDALVAILAKLDRFRGESRFTTWAARFVALEVANKIARHFWQQGSVGLDPATLERLPDRLGADPDEEAEVHELLAALSVAVASELSSRQRRVFEGLVLNAVPAERLAAELGTNRGALYKTLFDARRKLRAALEDQDFDLGLRLAA